jgi:GATA-binding protein
VLKAIVVFRRLARCFTQTTPLWRKNREGHTLCNACGLFLKLHGIVRPLSLKTDVVKKRNRGSGAILPVGGSGGASTRGRNKLGKVPAMSRPNTKHSVVAPTATATEATTQTRLSAPSADESESAPTSEQGSVRSPPGTTGVRGGEGMAFLAAAPPKATLGAGTASSTLRADALTPACQASNPVSRAERTSKNDREHTINKGIIQDFNAT